MLSNILENDDEWNEATIENRPRNRMRLWDEVLQDRKFSSRLLACITKFNTESRYYRTANLCPVLMSSLWFESASQNDAVFVIQNNLSAHQVSGGVDLSDYEVLQ